MRYIPEFLIPATLRGRYIYVALTLFVMLAVTAVFGWYTVQTAAEKHHQKMQAQASIENAIHDLVVRYQGVKYTLLEFLIQPDEQNYQLYNDNVLKLSKSFDELNSTQQQMAEPEFLNNIKILKRDLLSLNASLSQLIKVRLDAQQTFPFTRIMLEITARNSEILPVLNRLVSTAGSSKSTLPDNVKTLFEDNRFIWQKLIAEYRMLITIRLGIFSGPWQVAFEHRVHNIDIFISQIQTNLKKLNQFNKNTRLPIEVNSELLPLAENIKTAIKNYQAAIILLRSPGWRQDLLLLSNDLHPAFSRLDHSIQLLHQQEEYNWRASMGVLTQVAQRLSSALWLLLLVCSLMIFLGYFMFDEFILLPLRQVAQALKDEASGKEVALEDFTSAREISVLTDAFHDMRKQVNSRQQRLVNILDNAAEAIITIDTNGLIETFNVAAEGLFGYEAEKVLGENLLMLMPEDEREYYQQLFQNFLKNENDFYPPDGQDGYEINVLCNHHQIRPVSVKISKTIIDDKLLYTGLVIDISERLANEKERQQRLAEMAHVGRLSIMGEMAAGIAHELNQPLAAMSLYLQGSLRRCDPRSETCVDITRAVHSAIEQVERASDIIRKMRGFAKQEAFHHEIIDLNKIIKKSVDLVLISHQSVTPVPELQLSEQALMVKVDVLQIEQVLVNLIRNAFDAVSKMEASKRSIMIRSSLDNDGFARVFVIDSGEGVAKENVSKIFDTYFTTKQDGLGMGLSICRSIIEAHDGVLWYREGDKQGSQFCFLLPLAEIEFMNNGNLKS